MSRVTFQPFGAGERDRGRPMIAPTPEQRAEWRDWARNTGLQRVGTEVNKILDALDEAEAKVARVETLADNWRKHSGDHGPVCPTCDRADDLDAALSGEGWLVIKLGEIHPTPAPEPFFPDLETEGRP